MNELYENKTELQILLMTYSLKKAVACSDVSQDGNNKCKLMNKIGM